MKSKMAVKIGDDSVLFLKKLSTNRRKMDVDDKDLSYWRLVGVIVKYFKMNNERYKELVSLKEGKHG